MNLLLLVFFLWTLFFFSFLFFFNKDFSTPCIYFVLAFSIASSILLYFSDLYLVDIHPNTALFISLSCLAVILGALVLKKSSAVIQKSLNSHYLKPSCIGLIVIILLQILDAFVTVNLLSSHYGRNSLSENLYAHTLAIKGISNELPLILPRFVGIKEIVKSFLLIAMAYYSSYYIFYFKKCKKLFFLCIINFILLLSFSLLSSGRMMLLFGISCFLYFFVLRIVSRKNGIIKATIIVISILSIFFICFNSLGMLIGRDYLKNRDIGSSVFVYCGAEILALDRYINLHNEIKTKLDLGLCFNSYALYLNKMTGALSVDPQLTREETSKILYFDNISKYIGLGNVKTCLYPYLIDFGYFGTIFVCFVIGFISQYVRNKVINFDVSHCSFSWKTCLLCYCIFAMCLSFFSDMFFGPFLSIFTHSFWVGYFIAYILLFCNFRILKWNFKVI